MEFDLQRFIEPKKPEPPTPTQLQAWGLINALPEEKIFYSPGVGGIGDFIVEKINKEDAMKIKVYHYEYPYKNGGLLITDYANGTSRVGTNKGPAGRKDLLLTRRRGNRRFHCRKNKQRRRNENKSISLRISV